jgi:hypothetical protein
MSNLKQKWLSMPKEQRVNLIAGVILWLLGLAYVIVMSIVTIIYEGERVATCLNLSVPMTGGFDDVWPRILGSIYYICLCMGKCQNLSY